MVITKYHIPASFNLKVMHISDLHDYKYNEDDIRKALTNEPDIIVLSGDMVDRNRFDLEHTLSFINLLSGYPIYYVIGNHEVSSGHFDEVLEGLKEKGVNVLRNEVVSYKGINIIGVDDPLLGDRMPTIPEGKNILVAHRSEKILEYSEYDIDVTFSGHAHGGQFRFFGKGLLSPHQGFLPKFTSGVHLNNGTYSVISRGLGNSVFPIRLFNRPEIIIVDIGENHE